MPMFNDYAIELQKKLKLQGIEIDTDLDDGSVETVKLDIDNNDNKLQRLYRIPGKRMLR